MISPWKIEPDNDWACFGCGLMGVLPLRLIFREVDKLWHCLSRIEECSNCRKQHEYVPIYDPDDSGYQLDHKWEPVLKDDKFVFAATMTKTVYASLRHALGIKMMTGGAYGILDDFLRFMVSHVEKQQFEGTFEPKKKPLADVKP